MKTTVHWVLINAPLVIAFAVLSPVLAFLGPVTTVQATIIGALIAFPCAALILLDFAQRSRSDRVIDHSGRLHLGPSLECATRHTFWHAAWPHALNVAYSLGYTCLFFASGRSHPHVMTLWLMTVLILTVLKDPRLRQQGISRNLVFGLSALAGGLLLLSSVQSPGGKLKDDIPVLELIGWNVALVCGCTALWLLVRRKTIDGAWAWVIGIACFAAASWILRDFSLHAGGLAVTDGFVDLSVVYDRALFHTVAYCAWPHALNVFFSLGFSTLAEKTGSASTAMAVWLIAMVTVPLLYHLPEVMSSWQSPAAFALMILAGHQLWRLTVAAPETQ